MYTTQGDITCNKSGSNQDLLANFPSVPPVNRFLNSDPNPYPLTYLPPTSSVPNLISNHLAPVVPLAQVAPVAPVIPLAQVAPVIPAAPVIQVAPVVPAAPVVQVAPLAPVAHIPNYKPDPFVRASDLFVRNPNANLNPNSDYKNTRKGTCDGIDIDIDISNNNIEKFNWSYL